MTFVYITCKNKTEAMRVAEVILKKRLVACVNYFPINSSYWWDGKIVDSKEYAILAKTVRSKFELIKKEVESVHSYDIPCICQIDSKENEVFGKWVKKEVK